MSMNLADEPLLSGSLSESQTLSHATVSVDPEQAASVTEATVDTGPTVMTNHLKHMPNNRARSSNAICEIRPYLFLTGFRSISADKVKELGITHAVDAACIPKAEQIAGVEYIKVKIDDDDLANIQQYFEPVSKFIEKAKCSILPAQNAFIIIFIYVSDEDQYRHMADDFDEDSTVFDLQQYIQKEFGLLLKYQNIWHLDKNKVKMDLLRFRRDITLSELGMEEADEIIIKHSHLINWEAFKECADDDFSNDPTFKKESKEHMINLMEKLERSFFNRVYPSLNYLKIKSDLMRRYDTYQKAMDDSVKAYFEKHFGVPDSDIQCEPRKGGSCVGCMCVVKTQAGIIKFHVKTQHEAGTDVVRLPIKINYKELFVYKFLEILGIGAKIHYIRNDMETPYAIYIASQDIEGFKTVNSLRNVKNIKLGDYKESINIMLFLFNILNIGDHHGSNLGFDEEKKPFIIDFIMKRFDPNVAFNFENNLYKTVYTSFSKINQNLGSWDERKEIARKYAKEVKFVEKLHHALEKFDEDKKLFDGLDFKEQKTNDLEDYVNAVKKNVNELLESN